MAQSAKYYLTKEDSSKFLEFWNNDYFPVINKDGNFLEHAISRVYSYTHNISWINGLVDLISVLEILYLPEKDELSYRLSLRCATLLGLGKKGNEKEKIRKYIKTAYDIRSDILHERITEWKSLKKIDQELRPYDFINEIYEYTRTSIIKFLSINSTKKLFNKKGKKSEYYSTLITLLDKAIFEEEELSRFLEVQK